MSCMNSFIGWTGGKHIIARDIVAMIPQHTCYVEVFGGAGWVLFKKPLELSKVEVYNDLNYDLVNLFRVVRDHMENFFWRQYFLLSSREEFQAYKKRYLAGEFKDDVERAIAFYYLLKNSFGSKVFSSYSHSKKGKGHYNTDFAKLAAIRERLKKVYIESLSFDDLIPRYDSPDTLFFCDPPYTCTTKGSYYQCDFGEEDHRRLADVLKRIEGKFILSYDDVPAIREKYQGFNIQTTKPVRYSTNNTPKAKTIHKIELLITNF